MIKQELYELLQLIELDSYNNAGIVGQYLMDWSREYLPTLPEMEQMFREAESRVHLIGLPMEFHEKCSIVRYDNEIIRGRKHIAMFNGESKKYGLWIVMNGEKELNATISMCSSVDRTLEDTGFLFTREN